MSLMELVADLVISLMIVAKGAGISAPALSLRGLGDIDQLSGGVFLYFF